jgi:CPA1 family monovalent cation:H+ antiporter
VLDPELALALFVVPVLADAAFDASPRDLRVNWRPIASLALGAVLLTVAAVALVSRLLVPELPWAAAIALGAIVAPPDAAAATTVLKQLRPPHRLLVILEGESLFNDASALLIYRLAVGATITAFAGWTVLPTLLVVSIGSVVLAYVLARLTLMVNARITDVSTAVIVQFCGGFLVWIVAEQLHLSGIISVVVFAMVAAQRTPEVMPARLRIQSWAVWEVAVFVLNILAFILVGFQLRTITSAMDAGTGARYAIIAATVCAVVMIARLVWVSGAAAFSRWRCRPRADGRAGPSDTVALTPSGALVVGWSGMRGTVTLAAALALPAAFPYRDLVLTTAFGVTLGTLVLQGLTLRPLLLWLGLEDDGSVEREVRLARVETLRAAEIATLSVPGVDAANLVRQRYAMQLRRAERELTQDVPSLANTQTTIESPAASGANGDDRMDAAVARAAVDAQRRRLLDLRADGTIGDTAFHKVEEELDWTELGWAQVVADDDAR